MFSGLHLQRSVLVHEKFRRLQPSPVGQLQGRPVHPSLCRPHRHATPHQQLQHCCALDPAQHARPCQPPKRESRAVQLARSIKYPRTIPGTNSIRSWTTWPWSPLAKGAFDEPRWSELECWAGGLVEPEYRDVRNRVRKAAVDWGIQTPKHGGEQRQEVLRQLQCQRHLHQRHLLVAILRLTQLRPGLHTRRSTGSTKNGGTSTVPKCKVQPATSSLLRHPEIRTHGQRTAKALTTLTGKHNSHHCPIHQPRLCRKLLHRNSVLCDMWILSTFHSAI